MMIWTFKFVDVSKPFSMNNVPWTIVQSSIPEAVSYAQSFVGGKSNDQVFLYGGERKNPTNFSLNYDNIIYSFDTKTQSWKTPVISGNTPSLRRKMQIPVDVNGEAYLFGGQDEINVFKDMNKFDSIGLTWSLNISADDITTPLPRSDYTATILKNGMIIYIGGWEINNIGLPSYVNMSQISVFDTKSSLWGIAQADGDLIGSRRGHQAALTKDGKIIIYGGVTSEGVNNGTWISATPIIAVLDTNLFRWSTPQTYKMTENEPPPLIYSTSIVIGDYMILSFGNITNSLSNPSETSSGLYLLDTRNFTWVNTFEPPKKPTQSYTLIIILVSSIAGFIILVVVLVAIVCFFKRKKKRKKNRDSLTDDGKTNDTSSAISAIITPGSEHFLSQNNNQDNQNTLNSQNSTQFSPANSINFSNTSQTSSYKGGRESDGWDGNNMYYDRPSPQMSQMSKQIRRGSGQQYYQSYSDYSSNTDRGDGSGGGYNNNNNNNNLYNEYIDHNIPLQQFYSPNQPQIIHNDVYSGVIPQHGFIPQQGVYYEYDQPSVPFYHSSHANMTASPPFNNPSYSPPFNNPSYSPPFNNPSYSPPFNNPLYSPPFNDPSFSPPFNNPSYSSPYNNPSYVPPFNYAPPFNPSYSPHSHSPPFIGPSYSTSPTQLNFNDPNVNSSITPHGIDSTNITPGSDIPITNQYSRTSGDLNSNNRRGSSNATINRSGSLVDRIRRIGSGRRNRNSNTTATTNNTTRSSYNRNGLINTRGNDYSYGDYQDRS
ncbi:hypothetical protein GLOIN_2v1601040 [Rhizophagus clarus]|uniref:Attractin/MKLN-like beta-propeller domain-containing protein n=1 Tax=Rhizophagus clarus TaxID=94130 RepID=A0A8H3L4Q6_9GLOM|nr:hypothetical protein GLOIN_2v1601040 [Rhizophagus clarus]